MRRHTEIPVWEGARQHRQSFLDKKYLLKTFVNAETQTPISTPLNVTIIYYLVPLKKNGATYGQFITAI